MSSNETPPRGLSPAETNSRTEQRVLVVDDEPGIRNTLRAYLEADGYTVRVVADGNEVLTALRSFRPAVIILDIMLPGLDGIEILRRLRRESSVLVLLLSARGDETDRVVGLRMGADDYVVKPFSPREVSARVAVLLRRSRTESYTDDSETLRFSKLTIDPASRQVRKGERPLDLTPTEFDLLFALAQNSGRVLSREQLIERAWGNDYYIEERVVDVHIRRLRRKVEDNPGEPRIIVTVRSAGYRFIAENA